MIGGNKVPPPRGNRWFNTPGVIGLKDRLRMFNSYKWILGQLKVLLAGRHRQYFSTMAILKKSACWFIFVRYNPACLKGRQFPALLRQLVFRKQGTL